ncbi:spermatogenesis-associated protein 25 [Varanus komodoensis]|uniref:spermatogenesis-associated protein 25 n=1 Tax=Varanus komodoensis TaxID=61221 RepID=UPI001CF7AF17|nr:spermatogenesis-associated protein 25 [Varanus komodoensis]
MEKRSSGLLPPRLQGEPRSSREGRGAPRSLARLHPGAPPEAPAPASGPSATGPPRRKPHAEGAPSARPRATQAPQEPGLAEPRAGGRPGQGAAAPQGGPRSGFPGQGPAEEPPLGQAGDGWLCLPSAPRLPPPPGPGDLALARWGLLPRGVLVVSATLGRGAQPGPRLPPNVCILALAMMIAGIPTVPVPGVCEEDMVCAARCFVAGGLAPTDAQGEAAQRRRWPACKRDKPRKRAASRHFLPLFLAQLKK